MYDYSPIEKIRIRNFRNIGEAEIDLTKSPIVALVGNNEAGKTSVIKSIAVCALHHNPRGQKDYIRDNTDAFGVEITLKDGHQIVRYKDRKNTNMYRVLKDGNIVWDTNKITDGLPEIVSKLMGLIEETETGEYLHIRTYEDKLLLVSTPDSTNYKVMYNALKIEQLTKAIKLGSDEVNNLKKVVETNEYSMEAFRGQLQNIKVYDLDSALAIRDNLKRRLSTLDKIEKAVDLHKEIGELKDKLGAIDLINRFDVQPVNVMVANILISVSKNKETREKLIKDISRYSELESLSKINEVRLEKVSSLKERMDYIQSIYKQAEVLKGVHNVESIDISLAESMNRVIQLRKVLEVLETERNEINSVNECNQISDKQLQSIQKIQKVFEVLKEIQEKRKETEESQTKASEISDKLNQLYIELKEEGKLVEECPNCGNQILINVE